VSRTAEHLDAPAGHPAGSFACTTARRRTIVLPRLRLQALEWGRPGSPGLCLLHCGSGHAHWFDAVASAFEQDHHVVALDQRGHGESDWPVPAAYGTEDFVRDVLDMAAVLGWRQWSLVGHSMGGHNALALGAWHPGAVVAVVAAETRPLLPPDRLAELERHGRRTLRRHPSVEDALAAFRLRPPQTTASARLLAHVAQAGLVERDGGWTYRFDPVSNRLRRPVDLWPLLGRITAPTLVIRGQRSEVLAREDAEGMVAALPAGTFAEIGDAYHHVVLDQPGAVIAAIAPFLARHRRAA
jgi:pimeloyl-ACP methyl ester carboxylesterase